MMRSRGLTTPRPASAGGGGEPADVRLAFHSHEMMAQVDLGDPLARLWGVSGESLAESLRNPAPPAAGLPRSGVAAPGSPYEAKKGSYGTPGAPLR